MKKYFFYILSIGLFGVTGAMAQQMDSQVTAASQGTNQGTRAFKTKTFIQDTNEQFEIQGFGGTTFITSNIVDGTTNSYKHSLQIVVGLTPVNKTGNIAFQLIFYSPNDNIQQAAVYADNKINVYFPEAVYEDIRTKLEQSFATKKKVTLKVIQKTDGYREGTLAF